MFAPLVSKESVDAGATAEGNRVLEAGALTQLAPRNCASFQKTTLSQPMMLYLIRRLSIAAISILTGVVLVGPVQAQTSFTVNDTGDQPDYDTTDDRCDGKSGPAGDQCTLRAAIMQANATESVNEIRFDGFTSGDLNAAGHIRLGPAGGNGPYDAVTDTVAFRGEVAPGTGAGDSPSIIVDANGFTSALQFTTDSHESEVRKLTIVDASGPGISVGVENVTITLSFLGIESDSTTTNGNGTGISLAGDSAVVTNNIISGNTSDGISVEGNDNEIDDNRIGTTANGSSGAGNGGDGILIQSGTGTVIGTGSPGNGNLISANADDGIQLGGGGSTKVLTNRIGTTADGSSPLGNGVHGIRVLTSGNLIGDDSATGGTNEQNVISANGENGVVLGSNSGSLSADNNLLTHNIIGPDASASSRFRAGGNHGVLIDLGTGNEIEDNVISGNGSNGIVVRNASTQNTITKNFVGTNRTLAGLGNFRNGIVIDATVASTSDANEVGTSNAGSGNLVGANANWGVLIRSSHHFVKRNFIGTSANGDDLGNKSGGVKVQGNISSISIGGDAGAGNVIGFNEGPGIRLIGVSASKIQGNYIGTNGSGDDFGNSGGGISHAPNSGTSSDNIIGYGVAATIPSDPSPSNGEAGNVIANNGGDGIFLPAGSATVVGNSVRGNLVHSNTGLGVDLGTDGVTPNDDSDPATADDDDGENRLQNFPVITSTSFDGTDVTVTYEVPSEPNLAASGASTYPIQVDFYRADGAAEEGEAFLASTTYKATTHNTGPDTTITFTPNANVTTDDKIVATATDANGNTSEFSAASDQLPVEIASIEGTQTGSGSVELTWTTASETNNAGFRVEHQAPTSDAWSKAGFLDGHGTATESNTYRFSASDLDPGTHRFRLQQVDIDGSTHVFDPVAIDLEMKQAVRFSGPAPNPARGQATVSFAVREQANTTITVYNTLGQKVKTLYRGTPTAEQSETVRMDAGDLASGVYFVRLQAGEHTKTQRMTIVR